MLHFALCDDNVSFLNRSIAILKDIFVKNDLDAEIFYSTGNPRDFLEYVNNNSIDVMLLDIDFNSTMSGIELAKLIRKKNKKAYIIFMTGHFEYSLLSFQVKTFDFLVKPITYAKFESTILRVYNDIFDNSSKFINLCNGKYLVRESDVLYIEKYRTKALVHTESSTIEVYGSFKSLETRLPDNFKRCHKSYVVNSEKITKIDGRNNIIYLDDLKINYSKRFFDLEELG